MTPDSVRSRFRRWRHRRPFWGGFFLVLAAVELLYTANMNLGNLEVHLGPQGFLSYLLPLLLLLCGLLAWFSPAQRVFYGIVGLLTALYTFLGLNLGGFFVGMLLGIVGGALVIAWGPPRIRFKNPRALSAVLLVTAVTGGMLAAGGSLPARAGATFSPRTGSTSARS